MAEGDEGSLPELIVKEVVGAGLDSSMRESILEAVEDAEGPQQGRTLPVAVAAFALGTGIGYVLGSTEEPPIEPDAESLPIEEKTIPSTPMESGAEEETGGGSRLPRLLLALAVTGGIAYIQYRRRQDEEGWEPIDEVDQSLEDASEVVEGIAEEGPETDEESEGETEEVGDSGEEEAESETDEK